jgi:Tol biopolymer transport system component
MKVPGDSMTVRRGQEVPAPRRSILALAMAATLLAACGNNDDDKKGGNGNNGNGNGAPPEIKELNTLTGATKDVTVELREGTNMAVAPSPDGSRVVFSAQGALWVMPIEGGAATRITSWDIEPTAPVWSPDGGTIAFQNYAPEGNYHIWTIAPDGSSLAELTTGPNDDREPAWLPDGRGLVFASDRSNDGQYKVWQVELESKAVSQITKGVGAESNPVVSPDGQQVAFVDTGNVFTASMTGAGAPTLVAPGTAPSWLPSGEGLVFQTAARNLSLAGKEVSSGEDLFPFPVRFLPDGQFLYTADGKIRLRDAAGSSPREVPFSATLTVRRPAITKPKDHGFANLNARQVIGISSPTLSPDGKSVAFVALNDVWVMPIGQPPVRLTNDTDRDGNPQWTRDGSAVYFSSEKGNAGLLAIDQITIATKSRTRLGSIAGKSMVTPKMSPTGDRIAYSTLSGQLEVWNIASKSAEVIIPSLSTQVSTPSWTPDGNKVMVVDNERINNRFREGYNKLRFIDIASKQGTFYPSRNHRARSRNVTRGSRPFTGWHQSGIRHGLGASCHARQSGWVARRRRCRHHHGSGRPPFMVR